MSVLLVCTPEESYAAPFLQNSHDEVVVDTAGDFTGTADRVVVTGISAEPAAVRTAVDQASGFAAGSVDIGPLVGALSGDRAAWTEALVGLSLVEVSTDSGVPVARVKVDEAAGELEAAHVVGALIALPQSTVVPAVPAPAKPVTSAPAKATETKKKPAPQTLKQRIAGIARRNRKVLLALALVGLVALAIGGAAYAVIGGYYTALVVTAILGVVTASALRSEQQHRRLLGGDTAFQTKQAQRSATHFKRLARSMGVIELTTVETKKMLSRTEGTARVIRSDLAQHFEQVQATLNLFQMVKVDGLLPPMRGWAASPDVVGVLIEELRASSPKLIVECGSGVSTLFLALAAKQHSPQTRIVALDHDEEYAGKTRALLERHGVAEFAEVRHAPLVPDVAGQTWYDPQVAANLTGIDLLFVDGPPMTTGPLARKPALPVLWDQLSPHGIIVLDDMIRADEQEIAAGWQSDHPELERQDVRTEKGTTILRRR